MQLVIGITPELFAAIQPALTVYSQTLWIDPSFAAPDVLRVLPGTYEGVIANLLQARASTSGRPTVMLGHAFTIIAVVDGGPATSTSVAAPSFASPAARTPRSGSIAGADRTLIQV